MNICSRLKRDTNGYVVVEAAILFPVIIMIFAALVLLSMYLPQRAVLQEAAQAAAVAIATERGDTWIAFDMNGDRIERYNQPRQPNVYADFIRNVFFNRSGGRLKAEGIVETLAAKGFMSATDGISIEYDAINYIIYQEVIVNVSQSIPMPVNLSFIGFPEKITLTQEARAVVQNGDEFTRDVDIAKDMVIWLEKKFGSGETFRGALDKIGDIGSIFGF